MSKNIYEEHAGVYVIEVNNKDAFVLLTFRLLVSASQDGKLIVWDSYTTNKVSVEEKCFTMQT